MRASFFVCCFFNVARRELLLNFCVIYIHTTYMRFFIHSIWWHTVAPMLICVPNLATKPTDNIHICIISSLFAMQKHSASNEQIENEIEQSYWLNARMVFIYFIVHNAMLCRYKYCYSSTGYIYTQHRCMWIILLALLCICQARKKNETFFFIA